MKDEAVLRHHTEVLQLGHEFIAQAWVQGQHYPLAITIILHKPGQDAGLFELSYRILYLTGGLKRIIHNKVDPQLGSHLPAVVVGKAHQVLNANATAVGDNECRLVRCWCYAGSPTHDTHTWFAAPGFAATGLTISGSYRGVFS